MHNNKFTAIALLSVSIMAACVNQPAITNSVSPKASVSTQAPTPSPVQSTALPQIIQTPDPDSRATARFSGKVFSESGKPLDKVTITAISIDNNVNWGKSTQSVNGKYEFSGVPEGTRIELKAVKDHYLESKQIILLNISVSQDVDNFNFGGSGSENYSLKEDLDACIICKNNQTNFCANTFTGLNDAIQDTISGKTFDDKTNNILKDSVVSLTALDKNVSEDCMSSSVTATDGTFKFKQVPVGIEYEIKVTKAGFKEQVLKVKALSNLSGDSSKNYYDIYLKE
jgi:hypothetical protein